MSILQGPNGPITGQTSENFKQAEMFEPDDFSRPFHLKVTPGTDLYAKIVNVANDLGITPTKAARVMILGGWMAWRKFLETNPAQEITDES